jgi:hypothetical protein
MSAIKADCLTTYHASRTSGARMLSDVRLIVLHDTEGGTAESVARYFASPKAGGSTHLVVDNYDCYRTLRNEEVPWGAPGANQQGFHIEQCGYAKWSAPIWIRNTLTLRRAAYKTAYHCQLFDIPPIFRKAAGLKAGAAGITTHAECSKAFGGDHSDPGPFWPRRVFMQLVRGYYKELGGV